MDLNLKDKVVILTGATGGIGSAIARAFAAEDAKLAISSTRQEKLDKLIPTLGIDEDHVRGFVCDATKEEQVKAFVDGAKEALAPSISSLPTLAMRARCPLSPLKAPKSLQRFIRSTFIAPCGS